MDTVILVFRILFIVIGSLMALIYILLQLFQKLPQNKIKLSTIDYIVVIVTTLVFGFGTNSYYGLLAFLPLLAIKFLCQFLLKPHKLKGSGRWVEVDWRKLTPRGFDRNVPKAILDEMNKMPKDNHFVVPRFYLLIFIKFLSKRMGKEMGGKKPAGVSQNQQQMAMGQFTAIIDSVVKLAPGKTEKKDFPFGVLKVTRL
jgi:hypothetical protein